MPPSRKSVHYYRYNSRAGGNGHGCWQMKGLGIKGNSSAVIPLTQAITTWAEEILNLTHPTFYSKRITYCNYSKNNSCCTGTIHCKSPGVYNDTGDRLPQMPLCWVTLIPITHFQLHYDYRCAFRYTWTGNEQMFGHDIATVHLANYKLLKKNYSDNQFTLRLWTEKD